jgi:hypothetical protein
MSAPSPERSPERQDLADAIALRNTTRETLAAVTPAIARAKNAADKATARLEAAREAVALAREERARELVDAASDDMPAPASSVRAVRDEEAAALDEMDASGAAVAKLEKERDKLETRIKDATHRVTVAAERVAFHEAGRVLDEARKAQADWLRFRRLLRFVGAPTVDPTAPLPSSRPVNLDRHDEREMSRQIESFLQNEISGLLYAESHSWHRAPELRKCFEWWSNLLENPDAAAGLS